MSNLQEIESAIEGLPSSERWNLFHRLQESLWEDWDQQIEDDHKAGRLNSLLASVRDDIMNDRVKPLDEVVNNS